MPFLPLALVLSVGAIAAQAAAAGSGSIDAFWTNLQALCGKAYEGKVIEAPKGDTTFADKRLVMHVRSCDRGAIRIPFPVGEDRSRTWVLTRPPGSLRLKHDHRHEDGSEDKITQCEGTDRRFRIAFDLSREVPPPPAPW